MEASHGHLGTRIAKSIELDYLLYLPEKRPGEKPPLLLFLHGAGERGNDLALVKQHGPPKRIEEGAELPFIVVAPQCSGNEWWGSDPLVALLDEILAQHEVDHRRIYVTGLSMGGYGTWALANACPGRLAAIAPICGPFIYIDFPRLAGTPVWCFHGKDG